MLSKFFLPSKHKALLEKVVLVVSATKLKIQGTT